MVDYDVKKLQVKGDVEGIVRALEHGSDWRTRLAAAEALDEMGWKPERDASGAAYWFTKGEWARCSGIGRSAVSMLLRLLETVREREPRLATVRMLAELYNAGFLESDERDVLRTETASLELKHDDEEESHDDWVCREDQQHSDRACHGDTVSGGSVCL
jgi:hypothetical protein